MDRILVVEAFVPIRFIVTNLMISDDL